MLTQAEVSALLARIANNSRQLMYGSGLRLIEVVRLRVQDIDFHAIQVWQGKGDKNRRVTLAKELCESLKS